MQADNYFKVTSLGFGDRLVSDVFPFVNSDGASTAEAWRRACEAIGRTHGRVSVWRPTLFAAYAMAAPVIGEPMLGVEVLGRRFAA